MPTFAKPLLPNLKVFDFSTTNLENLGKKDVGVLHLALQKMRLDVAPDEIRKGTLGESTGKAIKDFQERHGLDATGSLTDATVQRLKLEVEHGFFAASKVRTEKVQGMLGLLGLQVSPEELKKRTFGETTTKAIQELQTRLNLPVDGLLNEAVFGRLETEALKARFSTKTQVSSLQRTITRATRIAKLEVAIDPQEIKGKEIGATTKAAISAFQTKYLLAITGELDVATMERLTSVAASRKAPVTLLKTKSARDLEPLRKTVRLNTTSEDVAKLQRSLSYLGFKIDQAEFNQRTFGGTTRQAVIEFQKRNGLAVNGHADSSVRARLNAAIIKANPEAATTPSYRVRGSVRDASWNGQGGLRVQVLEKTLRSDGPVLAERKTGSNGFYDLPYAPPLNPVNKQIKSPFHLWVRVLAADGTHLFQKSLFNPSMVSWMNFTAGAEPYRGVSAFDELMKAIAPILGRLSVADLEESDEHADITHVALQAKLVAEGVMRLVLAHKVAKAIDHLLISPAVIHAFLWQNLPPTLPSNLIEGTVGWTMIEPLVESAARGIVFLEENIQQQALLTATRENMFSITITNQSQQVLDALRVRRQEFALDKRLLVGNGSLKGVLEASSVAPAQFGTVAAVYLKHSGMGQEFWDDLRGQASALGGEAVIKDFETTARIGQISKHHGPTLTFLKGVLKDPGHPETNAVPDLAKLDQAQWVDLVTRNGGQVPDGIQGDTPQQRIEVYAAGLAAQSERFFPAIALAAAVARTGGLTQTAAVQGWLDRYADISVRNTNLDFFIEQQGVSAKLSEDALAELKLIQRIERIVPTAKVGQVLIEEKFHHSTQIMVYGKERFVATLEAKGVAHAAAMTVFAKAEFQYAQLLGLLGEYRFDLHRNNPAAIVGHTYTPEEQQNLLGSNPDLATLFGRMDFCDCVHCQSMYSPSAYLTDVLRFLQSHPSEKPSKTVGDVLLERRPDIANVKLNCDNTTTPLPYIDLVCEILEGAVPAPATASDLKFQTTLSAAELRAFPENTRPAAYDVLAKANYPMDSAFDLWQEETRVWLDHLGVPRHTLMETLQAEPGTNTALPTDASIAAEFWGISSHETSLITTEDVTAAKLTEFWGFDCTRSDVGVLECMAHAKLEYAELLTLLQSRWIADTAEASGLKLLRPEATCDLDKQTITGLTPKRFDRLHRFLRLWRRTGWQMWELDLLLRTNTLSPSGLDATTLTNLHRFRHVQTKLKLPLETALAFYRPINTEDRVQAGDANKQIPALYTQLFQNRTVTDPINPAFGLRFPINPAFGLPLAAGPKLSQHKSVLLAALSITEADLTLLIAETDDALTLVNLTTVHNLAVLAKGMSLSVEQLQLLKQAWAQALFGSPQKTLEFLDAHNWIAGAGISTEELDFLLADRPDSPFGLREIAITSMIESLRDALRNAPEPQRAGQLIDQVASMFGLTSEQSKLLLERLSVGADLYLGEKVLGDPALIARTSSGAYEKQITTTNFPNIFAAFRRLHKVSLLLTKHKITSTQTTEWMLTAHTKFGTPELNALPITGEPRIALRKWMALRQWLFLWSRFPEPETTSWGEVLRKATDVDAAGELVTPMATLRLELALLTKWTAADLEAVHTSLKLQYSITRNDYASVETYLRLDKVFSAVKRLGSDTSKVLTWALRDEPTTVQTTAQQVRDASKSKYDLSTWLSKAAPLQNVIREQKRNALIRYLVEHSIRNDAPSITFNGRAWQNPHHWRDSNDLLRYFLIDTEMGACQLTSRIKQAISSVQMFVQRCFLNLEQPDVQVAQEEKEDAVSLNSWRQWKYMKNYRVWEASRKVFLYPENWIQPELRDDKSMFFKELEDELLQGELTHDHAERAFVHYLEKLDEVAHLEISGVYHEVDDDDPRDDLPPNINLLHVVGRTRSDPAIYYYRKYDLNYSTWSAWERIDLDITGDHLMPVVYNRKLHLFWFVFMEKPQKVHRQPPAQPTSGPTPTPEPSKLLEIQLAWSVLRDGGWSSKRVSREKLIHPWERPLSSYHLKPRYKRRENQLWIDVYISTSLEFNNMKFYDPFNNSRQFASKWRFAENGKPWHSSSFIFDGAVVGHKMKPQVGSYHLTDAEGQVSAEITSTNSLEYVRRNFGDAGRAIGQLSGGYEIAPQLQSPNGLHHRHNRLVNNEVVLNRQLNILEDGSNRTLLSTAKTRFTLSFSQDQIQFDTKRWGQQPILYQDPYRAFFILQTWQQSIDGYNQMVQNRVYSFTPFYHPYSALFLRELNRSGLDQFLTRRIQRFPHTYYPGNTFRFSAEYGPTPVAQVEPSAQSDVLDFSPGGAYSIYNWEVFFHAPLMIACQLSQNQRFEEAMRWFHYIFDPTNTEALNTPQRFWITKPFFDQNAQDYRKQRIDNLVKEISQHLDQLRAWRNDPFNPHRIARYRPIAYQKTVVMKYIDNLIAWGDQLFRRDTLESINEASLLYVLAYEILGEKPVRVPDVDHADFSYKELVASGAVDDFGNKSVPARLENASGPARLPVRPRAGAEPLPIVNVQYFCLPPNDLLFGYWTTVEDRLFKIRNCMNIQGVVRQLPLFEPPIDPALLVKAAAAGVDIGSVLNEIGTGLQPYRFRVLAAKAGEFCGEVRTLGEKLLSVLEKQDAEGLALLRSVHEIKLLEASRGVRKTQIDEAIENLAGLEQAKALAEQKRDYYQGQEMINSSERTALDLSYGSAVMVTAITAGYLMAGGLQLIPRFVLGGSGFGGSPHVTADLLDGSKVGDSAEAAVKTLQAIANSLDKFASISSTMGSYERRKNDWDFQGQLAVTEISQVERQIQAAKLRQAIAEKELDNLDLQIEQSKTTDEYMRSKYTNRQLYNWMLGQLSTVYFQAYKLAFDLARRAEKSFQFELDKPELSFIQFGYWDSLKKGLLSGERLSNDLHHMESAYLEQHTRERELSKDISLKEFDPMKLLELKATGHCSLDLPEWLFDMDFRGHYRRRVKSVSITIPCVAGPYTGIHCTLSLTGNKLRRKEVVNGEYSDAVNFTANSVPVNAISTSHAQRDPGLFELNFNDDRYLPFEGVGAISEWDIQLPKETNHFDFTSISDLILHIQYTSLDAGPASDLAVKAKANLETVVPKRGLVLLDLKRGFATPWQRFLHNAPNTDQTMQFQLDANHLPYLVQQKARVAPASIKLSKVDLFISSAHQTNLVVSLGVAGGAVNETPAPRDTSFDNLHHWSVSPTPKPSILGQWNLRIKKDDALTWHELQSTDIQEAMLLVQFES